MEPASTKLTAKNRILLVGILLLSLCVMLWFGSQKQGFHPDEEITYQLSNSWYEPWLTWYQPDYTAKELITDYLWDGSLTSSFDKWKSLASDMAESGVKGSDFYRSYRVLADQAELHSEPAWHTADYFEGTFTVQPDQRFALGSVYYNQCADTHPPLYYLLVNFVSSLFVGQFSKWFALSVNMAAMLLVLLVFFDCFRRWFGGVRPALFAALVFGVSMSFVCTAMFLRMYALLTLFTMLFTRLNLQILHSGWQMPRRWRAAFVAVVVLGFYTQYYFAIYAAAMAAGILFCMLRDGKFRAALCYAGHAVLAFFISLVIWPFSLRHILGGQRSVGSLSQGIGQYFYGIYRFVLEVQAMLVEYGPAFWVIFTAIFTAGFLLLWQRRKEPEGKNALRAHAVLLLTAVLYLPVVAYNAPFYAPRYVMPLFPVLVLLGISLARLCALRCADALRTKMPSLPAWSAAAALVVLFGSVQIWNFSTAQPDTYPQQAARMEFAEQNAGATCIYYCPADLDWTWATAAVDMRFYEKTAMVQADKLEWIGKNLTVSPGDTLMVYIGNTMDQEAALADLTAQFGRNPVNTQCLADRSDMYAYVYKMEF